MKAYVFDLTQMDEEYEAIESEIATQLEEFNKVTARKKALNELTSIPKIDKPDPLAKKLEAEFAGLTTEDMIKRLFNAREGLFDDFDYDYIHEAATGLVTLEADYEGNLGLMEIVQFYEVATPKQIDLLKRLIAAHKDKEAWQLIQKVTGQHLTGTEFGDDQLDEGVGLIRKGSNVTPDVGEAQTRIEAEKLGFKTTDDGVPPTLGTNGKAK